MEPPVLIAVALLGAVGGAVLGMLARTYWSSQSMKAAHAEARRIEAEARARQKELILEAKDEKLRLQREAEDEARARRNELSALERRLLQRDEQLDQRTDMLEQRDKKLLDREREIDRAREEVAKAHQEQVAALERVSQVSAEDAKALLLEAVREEAEHDAVKLGRAIERKARDEADEKARDIIVTAIQRVAADHTAEHTVTVVHLPNDEMKGRIIGREGRNIRALEQATGVDLIIDDTPESVVLSGFDPVRREIARVALTKLIGDGRIHPGRIEEVVAKAKAEVDLIIRQAGETAAYDSGVPGLPPEIIKLLGRLKYRTSYGQNVLNHSIETGRLAAVIAAEIGADVQIAKMGGLLHDIGKAVDHEVEGPHAAIGAQIAQRQQPAGQGDRRDRGAPPGGRVRLPGGPDRPDRRCDQRLAARRPRRDHGHVRQAARGPPGDRRELRGRREVVRHPGRPRGPHPRPAGGDRRPHRDPPRPRHRSQDRGAADVPRPDQGHRDPRDARRGVREVASDPARAAEEDADTFRALERRRTQALVDRDLELARSLHSPGYELITPGGQTLGRDAYLGGIEAGTMTYHTFEPASDIAVRAVGDAAAVRYKARIVIEWEGGADEGLFWHTDLYERVEDRWQATWSQATRIPREG